mmetsp:Transcript_15929/g.18780  ORF Transcript_15929/g.18780 Transcript_15929/m.18780 type:complete len:363 (-) Transcript_15929:81-1169(-)
MNKTSFNDLDNVVELSAVNTVAAEEVVPATAERVNTNDSQSDKEQKNLAVARAAQAGLMNMESSALRVSVADEKGNMTVEDNQGNVTDVYTNNPNINDEERGGGGYVGEDNPNAVIKMGTQIRVGFRFKLLGLITLNLMSILIIAFVIVATPSIRKATLHKDWIKATSVVCFMWALFGLTLARDKYPYNYVALVFFTFSTAAFFGFMHYDFNDFANFQILSVLTAEMTVFTFLATRAWPVWFVDKVKVMVGIRDHNMGDFHYSDDEDEFVMTPLVYASSASWVIVLIIHMCIVTTVTSAHTPIGTAIGVELFVFFVCVWFGYDAAMIEKRLGPDDYMLGVVSFWADCIICVFCCCCIAFAGS